MNLLPEGGALLRPGRELLVDGKLRRLTSGCVSLRKGHRGLPLGEFGRRATLLGPHICLLLERDLSPGSNCPHTSRRPRTHPHLPLLPFWGRSLRLS